MRSGFKRFGGTFRRRFGARRTRFGNRRVLSSSGRRFPISQARRLLKNPAPNTGSSRLFSRQNQNIVQLRNNTVFESDFVPSATTPAFAFLNLAGNLTTWGQMFGVDGVNRIVNAAIQPIASGNPFYFLKWFAIDIKIRPQYTTTNAATTAATTAYTVNPLQAFWQKNYSIDVLGDTTVGSTQDVPGEPAHMDKEGNYHYTIMWRNKQGPARRLRQLLTDVPDIQNPDSPGNPGAVGTPNRNLPYSADQYKVVLAAVTSSGGLGAGTQAQVHALGYDSNNIYRVPALQIVVPSRASTGGTAGNMKCDVQIQTRGVCVIENQAYGF